MQNMIPQYYATLKPFDNILIKAAEKDYLTIPERKIAMNKIKPVYQSITGKEVRNSCVSCNKMDWLYRIGSWYKKFKEGMDK